MARLANAEVMGFFATPPTVTDLVAAWLQAPAEDKPWRLLDPCCGEGVAAAQLASALGGQVQTWGVELSEKRAAQAAQVLDKVHPAAFSATHVSRESVSLLWLNPPYDSDLDGKDKRLEIEFLRTSLNTLVYGGVLVYIVPQHLLGYRDVARLLAGHFEHLVVRRFPDGEFDRFKQVVVLAQRRHYVTPTAADLDAIHSLRDADLPALGAPTAPWPVVLPPAPAAAKFAYTGRSAREATALAFRAGWNEALLGALSMPERQDIKPALPYKQGHLALLMAAGLTGILTLPDPQGQPLLVKGRVRKTQDTHVEYDDNDEPVTITKDRYVTTIGTVSAAGVQVITDEAGLKTFLEEYGVALAQTVLRQAPRYDFKPTAAEWEHLGALSRNRKPLPGQTEAGMLPVQKHVAIALRRTLKACQAALLQGEMGTGKTTIALGVLDGLDAYPAILLGPPQLTPKWGREATEVVPGIQTRELRTVGDMQRFQADWEAGRLGPKALAIVSETSAKLGAGWQAALAKHYTLPQHDSQTEPSDPRNVRRAGFHQAAQAYQEARVKLLELRTAAADLETLTQQRDVVAALRQAALATATLWHVCPDCGQVQTDLDGGNVLSKAFEKTPSRCQCAYPGWERDADGRKVLDDSGQPKWAWQNARPTCGRPLYEFGAQFDRWPVADYIRHKSNGFFKLLIADEVHQFRGKGSDRGRAFHHLLTATHYHLGMTGTVFGGKSTSVFHLLYRLFPQVRANFPYVGGEKRWAEKYGVLETRQYGKGDDAPANVEIGKFNATKRGRVTVTEQPGISPGILGEIVEQSVFVTVPDLGQVLPPYREEAVALALTAAQAQQYASMDHTLRALALDDPRYLSTWLQWSLARPNSGFRAEVVEKVHRDEDGRPLKTTQLATLPAVGGPTVAGEQLLPKESWLVDFCRAEKAARRKTLVYCRQTAGRDIQPHLQALLEARGLRVDILYSKVATRKREAWINQRADGIDVLICNPTLVETGLDLIQFANVVFYEIDYDLFKITQAMRRVWRLGQTQPVKVIFTLYTDTLEEQAVRLMGKKMRAAQLLYGDEVGGAIVPDDDGNFLTELARSVLQGHQLPDLRTLFAASDQVTLSPLGSLTAASPRLTVISAETLARVLDENRARAVAAAQKRAEREQRRIAEQLHNAGIQAQQPGLF